MGLFIGQSYFFNDVAQLYLIFQPLYYTLWSSSTGKFVSWKSKGLSTEKSVSHDNSLSRTIKWHRNSNFCLVFKGSCLK